MLEAFRETAATVAPVDAAATVATILQWVLTVRAATVDAVA